MFEKLREVATVFLKLGFLGFGGPAAHIAMMEKEIVEKRKWISHEHFLDLVGATNLIPGPNSTEMTMHCGHERAGALGLFVAGICFIFPAVLLTGILAFFYIEYGELPHILPFIEGIKPAVIGIILGALVKLGKKALKNTDLGVIGAIVVIGIFLGYSEVFMVLFGGFLGAFWFSIKNKNVKDTSVKSFVLPLLIQKGATTVAAISSSSIFFTFLKIGSILFGSGYVLIAYLEGELVQTLGWLTKQELLDAIAMGQFTPGPVLSTATFIGYQISGVEGAVFATLGMFLPSFLFVWILNPLVPKLRKSKFTSYFLDSVNVASLGIMFAAVYSLSEFILTDWRPIVIGVLSILITFKFKKVGSAQIIIGGSVLGYILSLINIF